MSELCRVLLDSYSGDAFFEALFNEATKGADATNVVANELLGLHNEGKALLPDSFAQNRF